MQIGATIFAMRIPERWIPGKVDIIGHSHQLWHLAVVIAAYIHYQAVLVLLEWRDASGGCAAPGLVNGPVARVFEELQQKGAEVVGIEQVYQHLGMQLQQMQAAAR
jgi:adiponectin receptor